MERLIVIIVSLSLYSFLWLNKKTLQKLFLEKETPKLLHILDRGDVEVFSKQRIHRGLWVIGLAILSYLLNQSMVTWMSLICCAVGVIKWPEVTLRRIYQRRLNQLKIEFPIWLRQLQILLQHNTVLQSLRLSQSHAPILFKVALKELVIQLEETPQDLSLYTAFLNEYQSIEVQRAMKLLYRYNAIGSDDSTRQLSRLILATTKWLRDQRSSIHSTTLSLTGWWGMLPLLGVSGLFLVMMIQTMLTLLERR
jgi:hypothetical protein